MSGRPNEFRDPGAEMRLEEMIRIIAARPGIQGAQGPSGTVPIFANIAALTASSIVGMSTGSMAVVTSVGALWYLDTASTLTTDGITIVATSGAGRWLRGPTINPETAISQAAWFVDKQNAQGTSSDENSGLTTGTALRTEAEMSRRVGGWSPSWGQYGTINITLTYLSASTDGSDPSLWNPNLEQRSTFTQVAGLGASTFTGSLLAVTAKNIAGNTPLRSTFTTNTGAVAVRTYLVNTTRGNSFAFAQRDTGGGNWQITQPLDPVTFAEVDTWANGDAIVGSTLMNIDLVSVRGTYASSVTPFFGRIVQNIRVFDASSIAGVGLMQVQLDCTPRFIGCSLQRKVCLSGAGNVMQFQGCFAENGARSVFTIGSVAVFGGCLSGTSNLGGTTLTNDVIIAGTTTLTTNQTAAHGNVCLDSGTLTLNGTNLWTNTKSLYGPGTGAVNTVQGNTAPLAGTFVSAFPYAGPYQLNGVATAYSVTSGVVSSPIALTPTNLDAASGPGGFGKSATNFSGCSMSNGTQN